MISIIRDLNLFTYLKSCKIEKSWFALVNIQALLTGGIMGEETGSRSKFNLISFNLFQSSVMNQVNEFCLKITTYSIYEIFLLCMYEECPNFKLMQHDSPLNIQILILVVFIDATKPIPKLANSQVENVPCKNKTQKVLLLIMYVYVAFLKITTFLQIIFILHSGHTSLFLETVTIKILGTEEPRVEGREKQIPVCQPLNKN